jgi:phospho-N-acetylmuramoyl-pentapeptide-transferase
MGGVLILISIGVTTLLWGDLTQQVRVGGALCHPRLRHGRLGTMTGRRWCTATRRGWRAAGSISGVGARHRPCRGKFPRASRPRCRPSRTDRALLQGGELSAGVIGFIILTYFVINGTSNAVNLTDGLDGLAIMPTVMIAAALAIFAYVAGHMGFSKYLLCPTSRAPAMAVHLRRDRRGGAWFPVVQRLSGGSLHGRRRRAGARRGAGHRRRDRPPGNRPLHHGRRLRGRNPVGDGAGAVLQIHRRRGPRILRMAPLHHHFEQTGWKETQVVVRFWIITIMLVLFGLSTLKLR